VTDGEPFDAGAATWSLKLPQFEGPLDLLLHLCQQHQLDILNIPIGFVTEKYLEYLAVMQFMQLDIASEYLVMAATLAHIKSKLLLPAPPPGQEDDPLDEDEGDPRENLIRRLLEYQKYKQAGADLAARGVAGRDIFMRGGPDPASLPEDAALAGPAPLAEVPLFAIVEAFQRVLERSKVRLSHDVVTERVSLNDRIQELADLLRARKRLVFDELFDGIESQLDLVITFLALLEMTRLRMTRLFQTEPLAPLYVEVAESQPDNENQEATPS
jgi:segregation and condensation protein A